ncbi:STAS domain-containing protein [Hydrogenophaga sp.]|uniref:STAS domain-containing protein n=1 Tax=Hydrogenophaga sp. TaxID=1904254 RepID=UPI0019B4CEEE|nr:STAS domain-containing protein [Hydrogenophaga sp.]MBD3893084.1 STAS domain-containing protein [Hydrogenophaga sp.]
MPKEDSNGGFLSKVMRFVRHPTTRWADLDTRSVEGESVHTKEALKSLVERKRRNDFVRKREFDALRKIRSRSDQSGTERGVRPSFFQSSLPSRPDDRAQTLKKIDDIEAQMSMQWWKTKAPESLISSGSQSSTQAQAWDGHERRRRQQAGDAESGPQSEPEEGEHRGGEAALRQPTSAQSSTPSPAPAAATAALRTGLMAATAPGADGRQQSPFSASEFYALDVQEIMQDPEIEEAAIRFANGDDAAAEQGLLQGLGAGGVRADQPNDWLTLFDLYRATGQMAPFESRAVEFVNRFHRSAPQWYDLPAIVRGLSGKRVQAAPDKRRTAWVCEPTLDAHAVGTLQSVLLRTSQPWVLDWSPLELIDLKAARALLGIFTLWGDQDVTLCFLGAACLRERLKAQTPSGRRDVEQLWWELRLTVLRAMNCPDEFELTALDFCVTYEVSPPSWEAPRCHFQSLLSDATIEQVQTVLGESTFESAPSTQPAGGDTLEPKSGFNQLGLVELSGEIRGDPQDTLAALEQRLQQADVLIISCRHLIRVDFSAAGTLLNWVALQQGAGRQVQFVEVHRLVAAFFHVIGISEYAKVVLRND